MSKQLATHVSTPHSERAQTVNIVSDHLYDAALPYPSPLPPASLVNPGGTFPSGTWKLLLLAVQKRPESEIGEF